MAPAPRAPPHLELVHPELVARVRVDRGRHRGRLLLVVSPHADVVRRQVLPQRGDQVRRHLISPSRTTSPSAKNINAAHREVRPRRDATDAFPHHHHGRRRATTLGRLPSVDGLR
uniref:Uncharacterized protein n=1 Tax=Oryza brachyantha TaxID=4533 RepID=J3KX79_ORYBR